MKTYQIKLTIIHQGYIHEPKQNQISQYMKNMYLRSVINSLNPKITMAAMAHGGGNQLLLRLLAS